MDGTVALRWKGEQHWSEIVAIPWALCAPLPIILAGILPVRLSIQGRRDTGPSR